MAVNLSKYESKRRGVNDQYSGQKAANDFGRFTSQQRFGRQKTDFTKSFGRSQDPFMGGMARRGLTGGGVRSGAFQQALSRRAGDFTEGVGRINQDWGQEAQQFDRTDGQLDSWRQQALADIQAEQANEIAMAALNIKALRPLFGG